MRIVAINRQRSIRAERKGFARVARTDWDVVALQRSRPRTAGPFRAVSRAQA
jgi:hypothetical protein